MNQRICTVCGEPITSEDVASDDGKDHCDCFPEEVIDGRRYPRLVRGKPVRKSARAKRCTHPQGARAKVSQAPVFFYCSLCGAIQTPDGDWHDCKMTASAYEEMDKELQGAIDTVATHHPSLVLRRVEAPLNLLIREGLQLEGVRLRLSPMPVNDDRGAPQDPSADQDVILKEPAHDELPEEKSVTEEEDKHG